MFRYSSKKNYVKTANRSFNDVNFDFFNGKFDKYSRNKNNYNSSYNLNSDKKLKTSDCLTYDVSTKSLSFGTFPVSQQNTPENKRHSLNTKNRNTTDARKFLQNFSELKLPGSSNNEADENLKLMQLLNGDNEKILLQLMKLCINQLLIAMTNKKVMNLQIFSMQVLIRHILTKNMI